MNCGCTSQAPGCEKGRELFYGLEKAREIKDSTPRGILKELNAHLKFMEAQQVYLKHVGGTNETK
jgi:hypothetical protein